MTICTVSKLGALAVFVLCRPASPTTAEEDSITQVSTLHAARAAHTATTLPSGEVLIVGGMDSDGGSLASVELFDPARNRVQELESLAESRSGHTATLLEDGRVLIAGGYNGDYLTSVVEFDPGTNRFREAGPLVEGRSGHTATLLPDGRVLFVGGVGSGWTFLASAELYDPETGGSEPVGSMAVPRESHTSTLLADGRVLVIGGADRTDRNHFATTEIYDPASASFAPGPEMAHRRYKLAGTSVLLPNGDVLVSSGAQVAELLDIEGREFHEVAGAFPDAYRFAATAPLPGGDVLVTGGYTDENRNTDGIWRYRGS